MVKSYLKYEYSKSFGLVTSSTSNILWTSQTRSSTGAGQAVVAANEELLCWDIKTGDIVERWRDEKSSAQVTAIARSKVNDDLFAAGYEDGSVRLWRSKDPSPFVTFNGHRSAITVLAFDRSGVRLASGSRDTNVIIWDLVAEVGQFKLRGHKDQITGLQFVEPQEEVTEEDGAQAMVLDGLNDSSAEGFLLTTGKDALVKLWDLGSRHCIETHIAQTNGECWALGLSPDYSGCITAGNAGELKVWSLDTISLAASRRQVDISGDRKYLQDRGTLFRHGKDRTTEIIFHPRRDYFAVHGSEKSVEIWRIRSAAEIKKSMARKKRRRREKLSQKKDGDKSGEIPPDEEDDQEEDVNKAEITDAFTQHLIVRTGGKVRSVDWADIRGGKKLQLLVATTNNLLEMFNMPLKERSGRSKQDGVPDYERSLSIEIPGHRADVRSLALSSDDKWLASASNGSLKIWSMLTQKCGKTLECGYALCCAFLPGDKLVVVGTKSGEIELFEVATGALLDTVSAHEGAVWSLQVHPDGRSIVSGSADKSAKFWKVQVVQEPVLGTTRTTPRLKLTHARTLKVSDDILSLKFSPDAKLLAVALLDSTVKVFFVDSLKLYLNLYGHKLPALDMDISYDSKLIATCSADKTVRIWGLDFGDCHKALLAHQDSILQVKFLPNNREGNGHHFFSASKDRTIKYWDGDKFEQIQRLNGHHGEIWALAISRSSEPPFIVSASHDKSIRVWEETDEQIFLEEEREKEIEELYESTLMQSVEQEEDVEGEDGEIGAATKQTSETLNYGERIAEALELGMADLHVVKDWEEAKAANPGLAPPQRDPMFMAHGGISAEEYVMKVLERPAAAALNDALLVLPFTSVPALFTFVQRFAARSLNVPLTCRVLFFMLRTHHRQIVGSRRMRAMLEDIRVSLRETLRRRKDEMGYNMAALRIADLQIRDRGVSEYVDDGWDDDASGAQKERKRAFVHVS
ncbi:WD40 repeat-like protein [Durotheca rogersii]|uniref:WD40 repeat-like protein n=1 Tax=Durotheca rogersii TaxID=419775 RepID=UPI00221E50CD|nr:WD40 repeat-like protein [Durotheca rogersii]KAI5868668.1 WD40 repeat-like protein [Durotheca rogersii]